MREKGAEQAYEKQIIPATNLKHLARIIKKLGISEQVNKSKTEEIK